MDQLRNISHVIRQLIGEPGLDNKGNGKDLPPPTGTGTAIDLDTLDGDIAELIEQGTENGEVPEHRGQKFYKVVKRLHEAGHDYLDVLATLEDHPNGVQDKYISERRLKSHLWKLWQKLESGEDPGEEFDEIEDGPDSQSKPDAEVEVDDPLPERPWPVMDKAAYHGIAGEIVREIAKTSETDPVGLLVNFLVFAGNVIGRGAWMVIEATEHYPNLFVLTLGQTSRSRRGTTTNRIKAIFKIAAPGWYQDCVNTGELSSGEGYIDAVHDEVWGLVRGQRVKKREGVRDKRRLFIQSEFSGALRVMQRDGNILETVMCNAFDSHHVLETNTKQENKVTATDACISNLGHRRRNGMSTDTQAAELARLAGLVRRLRPDWRDAEGFYELRSEVAGGLAALSRRLGVNRAHARATTLTLTSTTASDEDRYRHHQRLQPPVPRLRRELPHRAHHPASLLRAVPDEDLPATPSRTCLRGERQALRAATGAPAAGPLLAHPVSPDPL
jgi:hypothetical protein